MIDRWPFFFEIKTWPFLPRELLPCSQKSEATLASRAHSFVLSCATLSYLFLQTVQQKGFASLNLLRLYPSFYFIEKLGRPTNHMTAC